MCNTRSVGALIVLGAHFPLFVSIVKRGSRARLRRVNGDESNGKEMRSNIELLVRIVFGKRTTNPFAPTHKQRDSCCCCCSATRRQGGVNTNMNALIVLFAN